MILKIFNKAININDFIPPIISKISRHLDKKRRLHPYNYLPENIQGRWILDVGANQGDYTIAALKSYPNSKVICFEPVKETFDSLKNNLSNYQDRFVLFNQALSHETGESEINITNFHGANSILPQSATHKTYNPHVREIKKETIQLVRLDDVSKKFPTQYIDVLKIDVEGYELNVLKGGTQFLKDHVDTIIIEISMMRDQSWQEQSVVDIFLLLKNLGFCLINVIDLAHADDSKSLILQMDCIFRHSSKLTK